MSDVDLYFRLLDELKEVIVRIHGGAIFIKKQDAELIAALEDAAKALKRARKAT